VFNIIDKKTLSAGVHLFKIEAKEIVRKHKAGQFIILRLHEKGERIPISIADVDKETGSILLLVQEVGKTSQEMGLLKEGDSILDVVGPLGHPTELPDNAVTVCVGGGIGMAPVHCIAKALKKRGNKVISIAGARTKELLTFQDELTDLSDELLIATDDGSFGQKGFVTDVLLRYIEDGNKVDEVFAIGPVPMMRAVCKLTEGYGIKTTVSLNPIMVDGTGMCGACRCTVGGETKFVCVDGPEFDGHQVDFEELTKRLKMYIKQETLSREKFIADHPSTCSCEVNNGS
jgi:ferredoxin--NADP+ reductase